MKAGDFQMHGSIVDTFNGGDYLDLLQISDMPHCRYGNFPESF